MSEELKSIYKTIARHIVSTKGQCVLILGPELSVDKSGKGYKTFFKEIIPEDTQSRYIETDNLFYFHDRFDGDTIKDKVIQFYSEVGDPGLLEMISRIPFPLIINVCPDRSLNEVYKKKGIDFKEGYFTKNSKPEFNDLPKPTKELPVIYNVFGSVDLEQSLILTHSKLYETIEYLMPEKSLPDNIELFLKGTVNSFIFLGFKFDSWYYQLICHKLGIRADAADMKTILSSPDFKVNDSIDVIMNSSFDMQFAPENPSQCIQTIIEICETDSPGSLREKNANGVFSTFISYARKDDSNPDREAIVDLFQKDFQTDKSSMFQLFRDRVDLSFGDGIDSYMTRIGMGKTVLVVVSDKYLKSIYCMVEAIRIHKYQDKDKRIFTIVMEDADIHDVKEASVYKTYWLEQCQLILKDPSKLENGRYDDYVNVYRFIDEFIAKVKDAIYLGLKYSEIARDAASGELILAESKKPEYQNFLNAVMNKLKEN